MAATFGLLINANVKGENNIKRLGNSMQGVQGKVKNLKMAVGGLSTAFKALGAALAVGAIGGFLKSTIDQADALGKLSTRTGIAANSLQAFVNAGKLADVSQKQLEVGLKTFARTSVEASKGVKTYAQAYASLGVSVKKSDGSLKASDDLLKEIADKFKDLPNGPEKAAVAMQLFGKSGADMITLLNGGSDSLERFNYEVSENFSQNAEYFNDQLTILSIQFDGFRKQLLDALLPALNSIIEVFSEMFATENDWTALFKVIEYGIRGTAIVVKSLIDLFDELIRGIVSSFRVIGKVLKGDIPGAIAEIGNAYSGAFDRAKKNKAQYDRLLYGTGKDIGTDYGGGGSGTFVPSATTAGARGKKGKTPEEEALEARQKALDEYRKMLDKLIGKSAELKTVTVSAVTVTKEQATAFDGVRDAAKGYLENIGTMRDAITNLSSNVFQGLEDALTDLVTTGKANFADFARTILAATARMILQQTILASVMRAIGALRGGPLPTSPFGGPQVVKGGTGLDGSAFGAAAFSSAMPAFTTKPMGFAKGGVFNRPTMFAFANGGYGNLGLLGEAGPEAILPLKRGRGGKLGVAAAGGMGDVIVNVDPSGTNVEGSKQQQKALGAAIGAAVQAELIKQKKPGGLLY